VSVWESLEAMPVVPIASLEEGKVGRVVGKVERDQDFLVAPLSGRVCVLYEVRIIRAISFEPGKVLLWNPDTSAPGWRTQDARSFAIVDDSGRAGVEPGGIEIDLVLPFQLYIDQIRGEPTPYWRQTLTELLMANGPVCVSEFALAPGDRATIAGVTTTQPDPDGAARVRDYRGHAPMRPVLGGSQREPLLVSNIPRLV
jgi:hypothetical protein